MKLELSHHGERLETVYIKSLADTALLNVSELCRRLGLSRQLFCQWAKVHGFDGAVAKAIARKAKREAKA